MLKQLAGAFVIAATVGLGPAAEASVLYEFTAKSSFPAGNGGGGTATTLSAASETYTGSFSFVVPTFVVPDTLIAVGDLTSCSIVGSVFGPAVCNDQGFLNSIFPPFETVSLNLTSPVFTGGIFYYFNAGTFGTPGTYDTVLFGDSQAGTLVITDLDAVPEPGSLALLGAGLLAIAGFFGLRRRRAEAPSRI